MTNEYCPRPHLDFGLIQVYTGDGKGKTTAALGQALRAAGRGLKVFMAQFMKGQQTGELLIAPKLSPQLVIKQYGSGEFIIGREPSAEEQALAQMALFEFKEALHSGEYDILILDEISHAIQLGLVGLKDVLGMLKRRPNYVELILTGSGMPKEIIRHADLVTEMIAVKHPYEQGIEARMGIEF
ncbi:MAG: cob(I)yrinic acid a,c-diamide adenosyltransferase [Firmicutes bacterium]|nr:cob(I)yrinic acid a,c-diamide adenosyltransferase [Bacillota bacterium]